MRLTVLLLLACLALVAPSLRAQSTDPGDLFVSAYMAVQAGDKAEAAGNFREANSKYRYAAQILNQISDKFPSWQPSIVDYRKKRTAEAVGRIQEKVGRYGGAKGATPSTVSDSAPPPRRKRWLRSRALARPRAIRRGNSRKSWWWSGSSFAT